MKFVFDLDGTICFNGKAVTETVLTALEDLSSQGHEVIFASARPIRDLLPVLHGRFHSFDMIGGNGSMVARNGHIVSTTHFDDETLAEIVHMLEEYQITYLIDGEWDYAYTGPSDHPIRLNVDPEQRANNVALIDLKPVVKILMLTAVDMKVVEKMLCPLDVVVHVHGDEGVLDVSPRGIDKWSGLQQLGVEEGQYIAFGNDANDISMFRHAAYSVMIGDHPLLAPFASEKIVVNAEIEQNIADKLKELGRYWVSKSEKTLGI